MGNPTFYVKLRGFKTISRHVLFIILLLLAVSFFLLFFDLSVYAAKQKSRNLIGDDKR